MAFDAVQKIANATAIKIGLDKSYLQKEININNDYSGPSYGIPSDNTIKAIKYTASKEGMITDPVYEGKSLDGLIDLCNKKFFTKNSKILYVHLGGAPAVSAYYNYF
jgi:1-aminocyclopropane-1-carboxylate deaminase